MVTRICENCGKEMDIDPAVIKQGGGIFCSNKCKNEGIKKRNRVIIQCEECGKDVECIKSRIKRFCSRDCFIKHSKKDKEQTRLNNIKRNKERKIKHLDKINDYKKQHPCEHCGFDDFRALEFHHLNPEDKIENIARMPDRGYSWDKIQAEIDKCIILCSNCHRILEWEIREENKNGT